MSRVDPSDEKAPMLRKRIAFLAVLVIAASAGGGWWTLRRVEPTGPPTFTGRIEKMNDGDFLLVPIGKSFQHRCMVSIREDAPVRWRDGRPATLATGQTVGVWCGPIAESMPPKCVANLVIVESDGP